MNPPKSRAIGTRSRGPREYGGFTLLEVLVALAIIATALVALLSLHARNIEIVAHDQNLNRATFLVQEILTQTLTETPFPDPGELQGEFEDYPGFQWSVLVTAPEDPLLAERLREIEARVFWDPRDPDAALLITHVRRPPEEAP